MDLFKRIQDLSAIYDDDGPSSTVLESRPMFNDGGMLVQPSDDGSRPGYSGDAVKLPDSPDAGTKSLGKGVYENTSKKGFKSYFGKYRRDGKDFKKTFNPSDFDGSLEKAKAEAAKFVKKGGNVPYKSVIDMQVEKGTMLEQPKYKTQLTKALNEVEKLSNKGYGNVKGIVDKYVAKFVPTPGTKNVQGKVYKTNPKGETAQMKGIRFAINKHAEKLKIQNIFNKDVVKALDAYTKIKTTKRGDVSKILKRFDVAEGSFNRYLQTLDLRNKIVPKFSTDLEKRKYFAKIRNDAINEFSSSKFEKFLSAPETALVQKSHMGDLYNQYVRTGNLGYAPNLINQEALTEVDANLKAINEKAKNLYNKKPKNYLQEIDRLNQKGDDLAAATQGFKKYQGIDPYTGKDLKVINFSSPGQELDPTDLFKNKKLSELQNVDKPLLNILKNQAIENAKIGKRQINKLNKEITSTVSKILDKPELTRLAVIGCGRKAAFDGGRINFNEGQNLTACATKGIEKLKGDPGKLTPGDQANVRALAKSGKAVKFLKGALGPAAILGEVLFEGGAAANKFMDQGMPIKQALGESYINKYLLGPKTQIDVEAERAKEFAKGEDYAMAERGRRMAPFMAQSKAADERRLKNRMQQMEEVYPTTPVPQIDLALENAGLTQQETGMTYPELQDYIKREDQMQSIADAGGVANMAGGGIAKMAGDRSGAMTRSMNPDSQGLSYLFNRVKKV